MASGQRNAVKFRPGSKPRTLNINGFEEYKSDTMLFSKNKVCGYLMKRIDERKLYHRSNFHKRWFNIAFGRAVIEVKDGASNEFIHK